MHAHKNILLKGQEKVREDTINMNPPSEAALVEGAWALGPANLH